MFVVLILYRSVSNVCDGSVGGKAAAGFMERCISYIGENAADCVKTNAFMVLSKEAVIKLISSDYVRFDVIAHFSYNSSELQLYLEEEDVWRAVLNWAKYQAGVTQPTAHWTEEERARVCQHLGTVIGHVRLLLIGWYDTLCYQNKDDWGGGVENLTSNRFLVSLRFGLEITNDSITI